MLTHPITKNKSPQPSARSNSFSQSSYGPSSDLPKERRHTLSVSLSRTPSKRSSEPRTEEIYAPDDGRIDPLSKRPWWSNPSRAPPKIVRAKDDLPRDPPPGLLARSLSLPVKPYQSERDRHSFSGTFSGAGSQMRGKIHEGVASGVTGLGGAIQGVGDKVLGGRRVKTDDVGMQEHAREAYYEDGYANPGYVEDSDYYSPSRAKGAGFRHSMSGASGVGQRIIHGMEMFETGVDTAGERFAATNVGGKVVGAGTSVATGLGNMASKVSSGTSTDRFSGNESGGKRASIGSSFASGVSNAGSKISSGASGLSDRIAHNNVGGRIAGVGSNVVSGVSSMGSKIAHSNVGEKITGVSSNVATGLSTVGSKIAHSNVRGKIVGVSSSVATGVSNVGSKIAIGASGFGDKITHSHVGAKIGGAGSSIAMGVSSVGSKVASGVGSVGTKLGGLVRGKAGREE
ncbi:hypothetical protein BC830DRAFT_1148396 [Chytriomyces sp. MP71]|nr:hypothetical protein BC830DRAFT_1148396 [Chytriomyces sp. MP71]